MFTIKGIRKYTADCLSHLSKLQHYFYNADKDISCNQPVFPRMIYCIFWCGQAHGKGTIYKSKKQRWQIKTQSWKSKNQCRIKWEAEAANGKHKVGKAKINTG